MNITKFIKSNKELSELPFLTVYQAITILLKNGYLKGKKDVD